VKGHGDGALGASAKVVVASASFAHFVAPAKAGAHAALLTVATDRR
jgi:hypothetical protein